MTITIDRFHECSSKCFDSRIRYYEDNIRALSGKVHSLLMRIERCQRYEFAPRDHLDRDICDLHVAMAHLEQISTQIDGEMKGLQEHFHTVKKDTLSRLDQYSRDLGWTLRRYEQLKGDINRTAENAERDEKALLGSPEEEERAVHDFEEPIPRAESPRPYRRRGDSPEVSDTEEEEEVYTPPTCRETAEKRAQEIFKAGKKWVLRNRGFAASIVLNVVLLAMRKFSRSCANA